MLWKHSLNLCLSEYTVWNKLFQSNTGPSNPGFYLWQKTVLLYRNNSDGQDTSTFIHMPKVIDYKHSIYLVLFLCWSLWKCYNSCHEISLLNEINFHLNKLSYFIFITRLWIASGRLPTPIHQFDKHYSTEFLWHRMTSSCAMFLK